MFAGSRFYHVSDATGWRIRLDYDARTLDESRCSISKGCILLKADSEEDEDEDEDEEPGPAAALGKLGAGAQWAWMGGLTLIASIVISGFGQAVCRDDRRVRAHSRHRRIPADPVARATGQ